MIELSQEVKAALKKTRWRFADPYEGGYTGREIRERLHPIICTSLYLRGLGVYHPMTETWWRANDGAPRCSRPLRAALLKACGLKEPR